MAHDMAIAGRHGMAQAGRHGMRLGAMEGWVVVFSGGSAYFQSYLTWGSDEIHVDWGDGTSNTYASGGQREHIYADNEEYTVRISGTALKVWFSGAGTRLKRVLPCDPVNLLRNNDISYCFNNCIGLTSLPDTLFSNTPLLTDASYCFQYCSGLTSLGSGLFSDTPALTNVYMCFYYCNSLTSLPNDLFSNTPALTDARHCFNNCIGLTSLPSTLFSDTPALTTANSCFHSCSGLTSLPSGLFGNAPALVNMGVCFHSCSGVTGSIPALWTNPNITDYGGCYFGTGHQLTAPPNWTHSVDNICAAACAPGTGGGWTHQWTGKDYCNC